MGYGLRVRSYDTNYESSLISARQPADNRSPLTTIGRLRAPLSGQPHNDHIKGGGQKNAKEGDPEHAAEDRGAERLPHLRARPLGDEKWDHAKDEGEGGHQDWAQTQTCRLQ